MELHITRVSLRDITINLCLINCFVKFSSGCYNKLAESLWFINNRTFFFHYSGDSQSEIRSQQGWVLGRALFWVGRQLTSHCIPTKPKGLREFSGASFVRVLIHNMESLPSQSNHPPKAHLLLPSHWRLRFQHMSLRKFINMLY
jgi:hypothetical protein